LWCFLNDFWMESLLLAQADGVLPRKVSSRAREPHERLVSQACDRNGSSAGQRMFFREDGDERFDQHLLDVQVLQGAGIARQHDIRRAFAESFEQLTGMQFIQVELNARIQAAVSA